MTPNQSIAMVLGGLSALVLVVKQMQARGWLGAEGARKAVHIGMGMICLTFPWVFHDGRSVLFLAALAVLALGALRVVPALMWRFGGVLHDVQRVSLGEIYFPLGVAVVFNLAAGNALKFVVPVALLTFADAAGALVGKRVGRHRYETLEGQKSFEGSAAVGVTGFLCVLVPMLAFGHDPLPSVLSALVIGLFASILEAISWRGLDNIFLPLAAFAQLSIYLGLTLTELSARFAVLIAITLAAWFWRRGRIVDDCARLGGALAMYFFWAVGGWQWLVAPVVLLVSYVWLMPRVPGGPPKHNLVSVICVGSAGLVWAVAQGFSPRPEWLWCFTLGIAGHQAVIATVRFSQAKPQCSRMKCWAAGAAQAVVVQGGVLWTLDRGRVSVIEFAAGLGCVALANAAFVLCERSLRAPDDLTARWWKQGLAALVGSIAGGATIFFL